MGKFVRNSTLTMSVNYSHDKCYQNIYNMNRHHEITRNIYDGKIKLNIITRVFNDNMTSTDLWHTLLYIQVHIK